MNPDAAGGEGAKAKENADVPLPAWQPFTFGGVAAFADARFGRVFAFLLVSALIVALTVVWFLRVFYAPVLLQAMRNMPETARITNGVLEGISEPVIAESKLLALAATPKSSEQIGQGADLQIQFRPGDVCANSIIWPNRGFEFEYERGGYLNLARSNLEPWWGAWHPVVYTGIGVEVFLQMMITWILLGTIYMIPARFIGFYMDRDLTFGGAWRLSTIGLLPGAMMMVGSIILYAWGVLDLVGLSFFAALHFVVGWVYFIGGVWKRKRIFPKTKGNPFASGK